MTKEQIEQTINSREEHVRVLSAFDTGFASGLNAQMPLGGGIMGGGIMGVPWKDGQLQSYALKLQQQAWNADHENLLPLPEPGNPTPQRAMLCKIIEDTYCAGFVTGINTHRFFP